LHKKFRAKVQWQLDGHAQISETVALGLDAVKSTIIVGGHREEDVITILAGSAKPALPVPLPFVYVLVVLRILCRDNITLIYIYNRVHLYNSALVAP